MRGNPLRTMTEPQGLYSAYLLRLWQTASAGELVYRASIEDAHSAERVGFGNLDELFSYLRAQAGQVPASRRCRWRAGDWKGGEWLRKIDNSFRGQRLSK